MIEHLLTHEMERGKYRRQFLACKHKFGKDLASGCELSIDGFSIED